MRKPENESLRGLRNRVVQIKEINTLISASIRPPCWSFLEFFGLKSLLLIIQRLSSQGLARNCQMFAPGS